MYFKVGIRMDYPHHDTGGDFKRIHNGTRRPAPFTCATTSKLKALGGCSSHHLHGAGAYCDDRTRGCTACLSVIDVCTFYDVVTDEFAAH